MFSSTSQDFGFSDVEGRVWRSAGMEMADRDDLSLGRDFGLWRCLVGWSPTETCLVLLRSVAPSLLVRVEGNRDAD